MKTKCLKKVVNSTISSLFAVIVVILSMFLTVSCEKDETGIVKTKTDSDPQSILYNLKVDEDGIIVFKDFDEYNQTIKVLEKFGQKERLAWENEIGFKSYTTCLLDAANEIDEAKTEEEFYESVKKNANYFQLLELKNGELSVEKTATTTLYSSFINEDGLFIISDTIYKLTSTGKLIYTNVDNRAELLNKTNEEIATIENDLKFTVFEIIEPNFIEKEFWGLVDTLRGERLYDPSGWINDRWVKIKVMAYYQLNYGYYYYGKVQIQIYGKKKNILGNWIQYQTIYSYQDVAYSLKYQIVGGSATWHDNSWSFPDKQSSSEELEMYSYHTFDDDIRFGTNGPGFYFTDLFAEGSHRGMYGNWAKIDY